MEIALRLFLYFAIISIGAALLVSFLMSLLVTLRLISIRFREKRRMADLEDDATEGQKNALKAKLGEEADAAISSELVGNLENNLRGLGKYLLPLVLLVLLWFAGDRWIHSMAVDVIFWSGLSLVILFALVMVFRLICALTPDIRKKSELVSNALKKGSVSLVVCILIYGLVYAFLG